MIVTARNLQMIVATRNPLACEKISFHLNLAVDIIKVVGVAMLWDNWCITYCHKARARGGKAPSAPFLNPPLAHCKAQDNEVAHPALQFFSREPCPISI